MGSPHHCHRHYSRWPAFCHPPHATLPRGLPNHSSRLTVHAFARARLRRDTSWLQFHDRCIWTGEQFAVHRRARTADLQFVAPTYRCVSGLLTRLPLHRPLLSIWLVIHSLLLPFIVLPFTHTAPFAHALLYTALPATVGLDYRLPSAVTVPGRGWLILVPHDSAFNDSTDCWLPRSTLAMPA